MKNSEESLKIAPGKSGKAMQEEKGDVIKTEQLYLSYRIMSSLANSTAITRQLFLEENIGRGNNQG